MRRPTSQKPVRGGRKQVSSCAERQLEHAIRREAIRFGVSRSFVIAVCCAEVLGVKIDSYSRR